MRQAIGLVSSVLAAFVLTGCGGGSGGTVNSVTGLSTATFIDSPVEGLEFESDTQKNGITDSKGNFIYKEGESISFHIGNLYLGTAKPKNGVITPLDLVGTTVDDPKVINILQVLQTLDSDHNASNGITIDVLHRETFKNQNHIDLSETDDDDAIQATIGQSYTVSEVEAKTHFEDHTDDESNGAEGYTPPPTTTTPPIIPPSVGNGKYTLVAWNDLGMHCVDGKDYSVFSILPPYNNLHAHLISKDATSGKSITNTSSGITLTYEAVADTTGSINTKSSTKTNFWDYIGKLFGDAAALLGIETGLTGKKTQSNTPQTMSYNSVNSWWEAEGIPTMPYDDNGAKNYYPMVKVVAKDAAGTILASTKVVLPVSDEMSCVSCHASNSVAAAKPSAGWETDTIKEKEWKKNILKLHDDKHPNAITDANMSATYKNGTLLATANAGQPILCASCHQSNALGTPLKTGIKPLTEALHSKHSNVIDPKTGTTMNSSMNRDSCYQCHPGSVTKCLRGAMGNAKNANGSNAIDCQSCHGTMSDVGKTGRAGWLDQPNCQQCHDKNTTSGNFTRYNSVFSAPGILRATVDHKFATTANTPMTGKSLYRFSKGHGNLQCESCHGSTHAEYPSSHANDNVQSVALQGHTGTIAECTTCHTTVPTGTTNFAKGPHGMHAVGQTAVSAHKNVAENGVTDCKTCHGTDLRGSVLSKTWTTRTLSVEGKSKTYLKGQMVSCYDCHGKEWK
ncbi:MAG: hypothetical protein Q7T77_08165 [Sulfuricurvum sp.]|nr:hypothetical protein [Sulfuricurvum sp.]